MARRHPVPLKTVELASPKAATSTRAVLCILTDALIRGLPVTKCPWLTIPSSLTRCVVLLGFPVIKSPSVNTIIPPGVVQNCTWTMSTSVCVCVGGGGGGEGRGGGERGGVGGGGVVSVRVHVCSE